MAVRSGPSPVFTELGHNGTERIHLHGILFTNEKTEIIQDIWKYGIIWIGQYTNEKNNQLYNEVHHKSRRRP